MTNKSKINNNNDNCYCFWPVKNSKNNYRIISSSLSE